MGFLSDTLDFEKHRWGGILDEYQQDPWRLLIGAGPDPVSTKLWGTLLDKDWEPMTDYWGNATEDQFASAEAQGINTGPSRQGYATADAIAKAITAQWAGGKLGGLFGNGGGASSSASSSPSWQDWMARAGNQFGGQMGGQQGPVNTGGLSMAEADSLLGLFPDPYEARHRVRMPLWGQPIPPEDYPWQKNLY